MPYSKAAREQFSRTSLAAALLFFLCNIAPAQPSAKPKPEPTPTPTPQKAEEAEPGYTGKPTIAGKPVVVSVVSPNDGEVIDSNNVDVFLGVENYKLAEGGNRLRVILNNESPREVSDVRSPLILSELPEGGHTLRVYAVDPEGKMLYFFDAFKMSHFSVRKKNFQNILDRNAPLLTVNSPLNGKVDATDDDKIWFDFMVLNAPLGGDEGYIVYYKINQEEEYLTKPEPIFWQSLKPGRYELTVKLLDKDKKPVPGLFNQIKRVFEVRPSLKPSVVETNSPQAVPQP